MDQQLFSALAEPNRFHIVELLREKPRPVGEIADLLHIRQPQASKHLKVLASAGIVDVHPQANQRIYALSPKKFQKLDAWLADYRKIWEEQFDRLEKLVEREKVNRKNDTWNDTLRGGEKEMNDTHRELTFTRTFDASPEFLYKAWTDQDLVKQWWGPNGVFNPICTLDPKVGGKIHIVMEAGEELGAAKGMQWPMTGEFVELDEPKKIVFTANAVNDGKETLQHKTTVLFDVVDGKTKMTVHTVVSKVLAGMEYAIQGMEQGWNSQFDKLVEFAAANK